MPTAKVILLIDDDHDLRGALGNQLKLHGGFRLECANSAEEGMGKAASVRTDLIVLDMILPDMEGREACRLMRKRRIAAPIIMLAGTESDEHAVLSLDSGANDYVAKPLNFSLFLARVRAHLRAFERSERATFRVGPYEFWPTAKLLIDHKGQRIRLTEKETAILRRLYRAGSQPVRREELVTEIWGREVGAATRVLETHLYRLRQKIEPNPPMPCVLTTEPGGYCLHL